jgi:peptidoglycan/xylan/chitin deacetylase (PgdA/CDA1 family)
MGNPLRRLSHKLAGKLGQAHRLLAPDRGEPIVLMYHGVNGNVGGRPADGDHKHVGENRFREHLTLLAARRRVVPLSDLVGKLLKGDNCAGMVAITFDDGYLNNAEAAAPVLKEFGMSATFFLATGFIGAGRWAWSDRVEYITANAREQQAQIRLGDGEGTLTSIAIGGPADRKELTRRIKLRLKTLHWQDAEREIGQIGEALQVPPVKPDGQYRFMSWDHARQLAKDGFEVGAHTINHAILSRVPIDVAREEILGSQARIRDEVGTCCPTFCYPNGKASDFNAGVVDICRSSFDAALSAISGAARARDRFEIRRIGPEHDTTPERLAARILQGA